MEPVDWRTQFPADSRERVVNKIMNTLRKRFPSSDSEKCISEIKNIALKFEEKIYMVARNQKEYVMKIMSRLEAMVPSSSKSNPPYSGPNTSNPGGNQGQSIAVQSRDQSQAREQHSLPNVPNTIASGGFSSNLVSARSTVSVPARVPLPNSATENSNSQKSVGNLSGQGAPINVSANNVRQEHGRQHSPHIGTQQNHEQLNHHLGIQVKQENITPSCIAQQKQLQQYQQQKLLKPAQKQTSQQSVMQTPAIRPSEAHVAPFSDLRQDQMSSFEQTTHSVIKNHPHTASRKIHQSQETPDIHQNVSSRPDNLAMQSPKQSHLMGTPGLQQQQTRLPGQPNNVQQWFQVQKMNLSSTHHEQLAERNNISVLQQSSQLLGTQCPSSGTRQSNFKMQEETQHTASALLPNQGQRSQPQSLERQLNSQSQPDKMRQLPNPTEQDQQQTYQTSGTVTSTSENRISFVDNWQEDTYRKVESLKSKFLTPLSDMLRKVTYTIQQFNSVSQQTERVSIERYKALKNRLTDIILHLNVPKSKITPSYKENLGSMERQILLILHTYGRAKPVPSLQHEQLPSDVHSMRQMVQLHSQTPQVHTHQDERKLPLQSVNLQCSATSNATNFVNSSRSPAEHPTLKHDMVHLRKNLTEQYSGQANSLTAVRQVASGSSKIPTGGSQKPKVQTLSQIPIHETQSLNALDSSCSTLKDMHLKLPKEEPAVQTQNPKQELRRHMITEQLVQQQKIVHQHHEPVKLQSGASFPHAVPKILGSSCQEISQYSSQIDKKNLLIPLTKARTTLYPANSPSIKISSLVPLAASSRTGDSEKPISDTSSLSNAGSTGDPQVNGAQSPSPFVISTPGMSASPLLEEYTNGIHRNTSTIISDELTVSEQPIQRLTKVVNLMSSKTISAAVLDIGSIMCTTDRILGPETDGRSIGSFGKDFVEMTNSHLLKRYLTCQDNTFPTRKLKRCRSTVPMHVDDSLPEFSDKEKFDLDSTAISYIRRPRIEVNQTLLEEITVINHQLIDTVLDISDEDTPPTVTSAPIKVGEGTIVRCSFIAVAISPSLKSEQLSIQPLRLLVPANYPLCSPIFLDKLRVDISNELEDLSAKVKSKLNISLRSLTEPLSLGEIARTWDVCARAAISEYAQQFGGGSFSSKCGMWEDCLSAA
ncbi:PREDICTED: mediator of RNA [Prunus dulcis]|uniref:PREDICTED: mediator of RNA n=1 Tax=Prunus dulcis TaxID=3755 RepID=A0A5E4FJ94_PRUDU|nr:mediator of RNA polymerase II transcription subunit 15a-like [Prunus dulcis]XP_034206227.1 mediator of RNA polymerase II transcription subunit 15a-like [Prunus dulcis]XP_034206282.1 mediator of RNA polymerase II transcription subunit 15a-like [Prunus dulcis]XP_034206283.1 mediator of RNA polymerase II transcription subunit 15a-like [Prunus dulcis]VVA27319.1 PREDICTED: mediator of RNA [Prunus dulcis]VVA27320.1 PREDICTED: mediator of RNA [Prunus dulcis]